MTMITNVQYRRLRIFFKGPVHGFGLRPTAYSIAQRLRLSGWVRNFDAGIEVEVEGRSDQLDKFVDEMELQLCSTTDSTKLTMEQIAAVNSAWFEILPDNNPSSSSVS